MESLWFSPLHCPKCVNRWTDLKQKHLWWFSWWQCKLLRFQRNLLFQGACLGPGGQEERRERGGSWGKEGTVIYTPVTSLLPGPGKLRTPTKMKWYQHPEFSHVYLCPGLWLSMKSEHGRITAQLTGFRSLISPGLRKTCYSWCLFTQNFSNVQLLGNLDIHISSLLICI